MEMRNTYKDAFVKKHGIKFGFMSAFLKAAAAGLVDMPSVNAVIDQTEIVYRDYVDISVAVATPKGLVVPVLRGVDQMSYAAIERGLADLGEKVRLVVGIINFILLNGNLLSLGEIWHSSY